ncbi:hypothetical protein HK102_002377 [Quaeritorhiza haematococci]|nr:hypothetical protein HK102_002377 [Quaeritorhiza haematococci]
MHANTTYAEVHLYYTLPVVGVLLLLARPFLTHTQISKITLLVTLALVYTTPWDNALVAYGGWTFEPDRILATVGFIPVEEYAFFVIQTVMTGLFSVLMTQWNIHILCLKTTPTWVRTGPVCFFAATFLTGLYMLVPGSRTFYLGAILSWVSPVLALQWSIAGPYIWNQFGRFVFTVAVPTLCLWWLDHHAIKARVWIISKETSIGWFVTPHLPLEEALFFLVSNCMVVAGMMAVDRTLAIKRLMAVKTGFGPTILHQAEDLVRHTLTFEANLDQQAIHDLANVVALIRHGSKSFSIASSLFHQGIRQHVIELYGFCRVTDDVFDDPTLNHEEKTARLAVVKDLVDRIYDGAPSSPDGIIDWDSYRGDFGVHGVSAFRLLSRLVARDRACPLVPKHAIMELLSGYDLDLHPETNKIRTEADLISYAEKVASSVATACTHIMFRESDPTWNTFPSWSQRSDEGGDVDMNLIRRKHNCERAIRHARDMGLALQLINQARDIVTDAALKRCYIPDVWFLEYLSTESVIVGNPLASPSWADMIRASIIADPWGNESGSEKQKQTLRHHGPKALRWYSERFITVASKYTGSARAGVYMLPPSSRAPALAALLIYLGIGNVIKASPTDTYPVRARTSWLWKLWVVFACLYLE